MKMVLTPFVQLSLDFPSVTSSSPSVELFDLVNTIFLPLVGCLSFGPDIFIKLVKVGIVGFIIDSMLGKDHYLLSPCLRKHH
jgi:hypothetical protein